MNSKRNRKRVFIFTPWYCNRLSWKYSENQPSLFSTGQSAQHMEGCFDILQGKYWDLGKASATLQCNICQRKWYWRWSVKGRVFHKNIWNLKTQEENCLSIQIKCYGVKCLSVQEEIFKYLNIFKHLSDSTEHYIDKFLNQFTLNMSKNKSSLNSNTICSRKVNDNQCGKCP